ncbi:hypothetical protein CY0110_19592 [Crocosphaera chwakensis CCY0110]|uniref:Uncharacterized protein n=1 Tax=Crocosphaera chwakensis CCY0110 TaxID=391612 RepID=A3IJQ0_9CHRO|nr:hypothetical protein CY0110_19592 [Crocosphaera chwakensis CCY0110]
MRMGMRTFLLNGFDSFPSGGFHQSFYFS